MIYDPYSRPFQEDPYPLYKHFRDEEPCTYNPSMDFYALFRFEDVWNATLDWETMSSSLGPVLENRGQIPSSFLSIIGMDPPAHTKLRNVISRGFTPRRIAALEDEIRGIAKHYLEPLATRDAFDIEQEFAVKFPMDVISALLGIPEEYRETYRHQLDAGLNRDPDKGFDAGGDPEDRQRDGVHRRADRRATQAAAPGSRHRARHDGVRGRGRSAAPPHRRRVPRVRDAAVRALDPRRPRS